MRRKDQYARAHKAAGKAAGKIEHVVVELMTDIDALPKVPMR
jgi:hypothetical protein